MTAELARPSATQSGRVISSLRSDEGDRDAVEIHASSGLGQNDEVSHHPWSQDRYANPPTDMQLPFFFLSVGTIHCSSAF